MDDVRVLPLTAVVLAAVLLLIAPFAWTGFASVAIVLQAIIFGAAHAYQGWTNVMLIGIWALIFGVAAWLRRGLRGNMIAHAAIDALAAFSSR